MRETNKGMNLLKSLFSKSGDWKSRYLDLQGTKLMIYSDN